MCRVTIRVMEQKRQENLSVLNVTLLQKELIAYTGMREMSMDFTTKT